MLATHLILFLAALIYGATGFGFGLVSLPLLTRTFEPAVVAPMITLIVLPLTVALLLEARKWVRRRLFLPLFAGSLVGAPLGVFLLDRIPAAPMRVAVGITVAVLAGVLLSGWKHPFENQRWGSVTSGALAGLLGTAMAIPGPPVLLFLANQGERKTIFRANLIAFFFATGLLSLAAYAVAGLIDREVLRLSVSLLPATLVGIAAGALLARRIDEKAFRTGTLVLVLIAGLTLLI